MELSIVTGTYNRLPYLKDMIESVRRSLGYGIPYEMVVVDGGSKDGTLQWCKDQLDINLIEQGELLGAVKAFNAGAYAARGKYVVLANDDIIFIDESLLAAYAFIEDNPGVGIGCFWQDRGGYDWHVDTMPAIVGDRQVRVHYGQVCIVPKDLGDRVGWWGNYLRTYGGDNELSCNVIELGYSVAPIPCACIHDTTPMDELRHINNIPGTNTDSVTWTRKWTKSNGLVGPLLKRGSTRRFDRMIRVLYAPIYEQGYTIQKTSKRGLREALKNIGTVVEVDYNSEGFGKVYDVSISFKPDIILTQVHSASSDVNSEAIKELREANPNAELVNWNGDYHPEYLFDPEYIRMMMLYDACGFVTTMVGKVYDKVGINWFYWQIGYEEADTSKIAWVPSFDVLFLGNGYSNNRLQLARNLRILERKLGITVGIYGSWDKSIMSEGQNLYNFDEGAALYEKCKIAIGDNQWGNEAVGFVSNRLFQAMAAGAFMLHQRVPGLEELLGLKDKVDLSFWDDFDDLEKKIQFWLEHERFRKAVAASGKRKVHLYHSFDHRVKELLDYLGWDR